MVTSRLGDRRIPSGYTGQDEAYIKRGSPEWNAAWERLESFLLSEFGDDVGQKLCNQYACYYATVPKLKEHVFGLKEATNEQLEAKIGLHVNFCLLNSCLHVPFLED